MGCLSKTLLKRIIKIVLVIMILTEGSVLIMVMSKMKSVSLMENTLICGL